VAAQEATPHTSPTTRQVVLELRGQPLHMFSFSLAEYYLDGVNQENGSRARTIMKAHMHSSTWTFYDDGTLEFVGGAGMPSQLKRLSGTYTYNPDNGLASFAVGTVDMDSVVDINAAGFTGVYNPTANNVMLLYGATYNLSGHWHRVVGAFGQDMTVTYPR
jgi:hypothetical protein